MAKAKPGSPAVVAEEPKGEAYEPPTPIDESAVESEVTALVVPKGSTAVRTMDDLEALMMQDSEQGDNFEKGDVALPFMRVLQSNSPQVKPKNAKYIDGAQEGSFFNSATNRVYDGDAGIFAIACWFEKQATLWVPRTTEGGGGFVGQLSVPDALEILKRCTKNEKKKDITPADLKGPAGSINPDWGNKELSIAALYYLLVFPAGEGGTFEEAANFEPVAYPFTSTQMKKSRSWNAIIRNARLPMPSGGGSYKAPMHGFVYHFTTVPESNAQGEWMGVKIKQMTPLLKYEGGKPVESFSGAGNLFLAARDFKIAVEGGTIKAKAAEGYDDIEVGGEGGQPAPGGSKKGEDDDLPF